MGIDGLKSSISKLATNAQKKLEEVAKPAKPSAPPAPKKAAGESYAEPKKKPVSITGKVKKYVPAGEASAELKATVASLRTLAQSGVATAKLSSDQVCTDGDLDSLKKAIANKDDAGIRKVANADPGLLRQLSPNEKGRALETLRSGVCTDADEQAMVNIVRSCETKGELRAVMQAAAGGYGQEQLHKFDKELTDHHPYLIADLLNPANASLPEVHPGSINASSHVTDPKDYPVADMDQKVSLAKGDEAARKAFIEGLTQVDSKRATRPDQTDGCSAMCIIASTLQSDDPKAAMAKLCHYNAKNMDSRDGVPKFEERKQQLAELKKRIEAGEPVSKKDIALLQETTYNTLRVREGKIPGANTENNVIDGRAVEGFLEQAGIGTSGGVPRLIDIDESPKPYRDPKDNGSKQPEHFVLVRPNGEIYDPWPHKDGKQIIPPGTDESKKYHQNLSPIG